MTMVTLSQVISAQVVLLDQTVAVRAKQLMGAKTQCLPISSGTLYISVILSSCEPHIIWMQPNLPTIY